MFGEYNINRYIRQYGITQKTKQELDTYMGSPSYKVCYSIDKTNMVGTVIVPKHMVEKYEQTTFANWHSERSADYDGMWEV